MTRLVRAAYFVFILSVPIETIDFFGAQTTSRVISLSRVLALLVLALAITDWRRCFRNIPLEFWLVGWYIAAYCASQLRLEPSQDWNFFKTQMMLFYGASVFLVSTNLFADEEYRTASLSRYGWWVSIVAAAMILGAIASPSGREDRSSIVGQNPNTAASLFAVGVLCIAGNKRLFAAKRLDFRHLLAPAAIGALIAAILRTGSRGGLLSLGAGILGLALAGGRATRKQRVLIAGILLSAMGALIAHEFQKGTQTATRLAESWTEGDTAGRDKIFAEAWKMFGERPLLGFGGVENNIQLGLRLDYARTGQYNRGAHNLALQTLTEVGIVGAVPLFLALLVALYRSWRHARFSGDALPFALMCAELVVNQSGVETNQSIFWIVVAAAASVSDAPT